MGNPMLVCSCNYITDRDITDVINQLLDEDCWQLIVPAKVYHAMAKRGRCCGCFPTVVDLIIRTTEQYHARHHSDGDKVVDFIDRLKRFHEDQQAAARQRREQLAKRA